MSDEAGPTPTERIEQLEEQIGDLQDAIRRSRRLAAAGQVGGLAGAALLVSLVIGLVDFAPIRLILGISAALGGLVLAGSRVGSTKQFERALKRTEAERNAAIDDLAFIEVDDNRGERPD